MPNYIDGQLKVKTRINDRNEFTIIGVAGFDNMKLNQNPDDRADEYLLSYLPKLKQETFTVGASYKHFQDNHIQTYSLSYNYLNNRSIKYLDNDESLETNLIQQSSGLEGKAQGRFENRSYYGAWTIREGADINFRHYNGDVYRKLYSGLPMDYGTRLNLFGWGLYASADYKSPQGKVNTSFGLRMDGSSFSKNTAAIWKQHSPIASVSYMPWKNWSLNASAGL